MNPYLAIVLKSGCFIHELVPIIQTDYIKKHQEFLYLDFQAKFGEIFEKDGSFSIHRINIQTLATEIFIFFNGLSPPVMNEVHCSKDKNELYSRNPKTVS